MSAPTFLSVDAAVKALGSTAHLLSVCDGRQRCGSIIDADVGRGLSEAYAFDREGRALGTFRNRRLALAAIVARDEFETERLAA